MGTEYTYDRLWVRAEYKILRPGAVLPRKAKPTDAAYDIFAGEDVVVLPHSMSAIKTGVAVAVPEGFYLTVEGRSGLAARKQIDVFRGVIDATYNGELVVTLINNSDFEFRAPAGSRIAQLVVHRQIDLAFSEVEEFSPEYNKRGKDGFGSTGA